MEDTGNTAAPSTPQATPPNQSGGAKRARTAPGRFGAYGGRYVPETLMAALQELEREYAEARKDEAFQRRIRPACCTTSPDARRRSFSPSGSPKSWAARRST